MTDPQYGGDPNYQYQQPTSPAPYPPVPASPYQQQPYQQPMQAVVPGYAVPMVAVALPPTSGVAVASMVLGICGVVFGWFTWASRAFWRSSSATSDRPDEEQHAVRPWHGHHRPGARLHPRRLHAVGGLEVFFLSTRRAWPSARSTAERTSATHRWGGRWVRLWPPHRVVRDGIVSPGRPTAGRDSGIWRGTVTYPPNGPGWEDPATRGYPPTQPGQPFSAQPYSPGPYNPQPYGTEPYGAQQPYAVQPDPYAYPPVPQPIPYAYAQPVMPVVPMPMVSMVAMPTVQTSGISVASMVLGIVGVVFGWCMFGVPSLLAVIFGHVGLNDTRTNQRAGRGMAVAGLILGYVALVPALWLTFLYWNIVGHAATIH